MVIGSLGNTVSVYKATCILYIYLLIKIVYATSLPEFDCEPIAGHMVDIEPNLCSILHIYILRFFIQFILAYALIPYLFLSLIFFLLFSEQAQYNKNSS